MRKSLKRLSAMAMALCLTLGVGYSVKQSVSAITETKDIEYYTQNANTLKELYDYIIFSGNEALVRFSVMGQNDGGIRGINDMKWEVTGTADTNFKYDLFEVNDGTPYGETYCLVTANSPGTVNIKGTEIDCFKKTEINSIYINLTVNEDGNFDNDVNYDKPIENKIKGDVNADGEFNVADVVALQKWLLGNAVELKNWKAADLCEDNKLDVFDLCLMKRELINSGIVKRNMTKEEFLEILLNNDEFTWSDFEQYKSEDIGSGIFILRYEVEMEDDDNLYLYVTGSDMNETPDDIYLMRSDDPCNEDYEKEDIYKLKSLLILMTPPDNSEEDRETAQEIADFAFSELKNGNMTIGESWNSHEIDDTELAEAYKAHYFSYFKFINENTLMITLDRGGFFKVYGYLITDGTVEYPLGWNDNINDGFDGGGVFVNERYDNIYFFCAGT